MSGGVKEIDNGYKALIDAIFVLDKPKIAVGVFEADGQVDVGGGTTLIEVAIINEFGGEGIPARSFLRAWFDENKERAQKALMVLLQGVIKGDTQPKQALERFGLWLQGEIQRRIAQGIPPTNADSTIAKKGSSKPLIATGQLRSSITFAIDWGNGDLKVVPSNATKQRAVDAKAQARAQRKALKRKATLRRQARRKAIRQGKRAVKKGVKRAIKTSSKFLRRVKRAALGKRRRR